MGERLDDCLRAQDLVEELEMDYPGPNMLTVGVESKLTFLSALLQVAEQRQNALTKVYCRRGRDEALQRVAARTWLDRLGVLVALLRLWVPGFIERFGNATSGG